MNNETLPRVYVGTYAKYNQGNLAGVWLDLADYSSKDEFMEAALELHKDETDPELMFQDFEGFPASMYSESSINEAIWDMLETEGGWGAKWAFVECFGEWDATRFEDSYLGWYDRVLEYAYEYVDASGMLSGVPENIARYFDYKKFAHDLSFDISEHNGHLFSSNW